MGLFGPKLCPAAKDLQKNLRKTIASYKELRSWVIKNIKPLIEQSSEWGDTFSTALKEIIDYLEEQDKTIKKYDPLITTDAIQNYATLYRKLNDFHTASSRLSEARTHIRSTLGQNHKLVQKLESIYMSIFSTTMHELLSYVTVELKRNRPERFADPRELRKSA